MRKNYILAAALAVAIAFILLFPIGTSYLRPAVKVKSAYVDTLLQLKDLGFQLGEYPVGALILYKDSILGSGTNTTKSQNTALGHAEINALQAVLDKMPYQEFRALNRDSLILLTTFEPCTMCKGVINHFDIRKVYYLDAKRPRYRWGYIQKDLSFYLRIRKFKAGEDQ